MPHQDHTQSDTFNISEKFDSTGKRIKWWNQLSIAWKRAFSQAVFRSSEILTNPSDTQLQDLLTRPALRFVGPGGMNPNIGFQLEELSGISELDSVKILVVTYHKIKSITELSRLKKLESLYINNNQIKDLDGIQNALILGELICSDNLIDSLKPLKKLRFLKSLNVDANQLKDLDGIVTKYKQTLKEIYIKHNPDLDWRVKRDFEEKTGIQCK